MPRRVGNRSIWRAENRLPARVFPRKAFASGKLRALGRSHWVSGGHGGCALGPRGQPPDPAGWPPGLLPGGGRNGGGAGGAGPRRRLWAKSLKGKDLRQMWLGTGWRVIGRVPGAWPGVARQPAEHRRNAFSASDRVLRDRPFRCILRVGKGTWRWLGCPAAHRGRWFRRALPLARQASCWCCAGPAFGPRGVVRRPGEAARLPSQDAPAAKRPVAG